MSTINAPSERQAARDRAAADRAGPSRRDRPRMVSGPVNKTLGKQMEYKGDDGLTDIERASYAACVRLSCLHEACYKRFMYLQPERQQKECGPLMDDWKRCFREETQRRGPQQ